MAATEENQRGVESDAAVSSSSASAAAAITEPQPIRPIANINGPIASPKLTLSGFILGRSLGPPASNMATALKQLDKSLAVNGFEEAEKDLKRRTLMASESERKRLKDFALPGLTSLGACQVRTTPAKQVNSTICLVMRLETKD